MENVNISEFRANLLKYLKKAQHGEQINISSNGELLATITPPIALQSAAKDKLKKLAKTSVIHDVVGPFDEKWDAM